MRKSASNPKPTRPRVVKHNEVTKLLKEDPSGRRLAELLIKNGMGAPVERVDDDFPPLPSLG